MKSIITRDCDYINDNGEKKIIRFHWTQERTRYLSWLESHNRRSETVLTYRRQLDAIAPNVMDVLGWFPFEEIGEDELYALLDSFRGVCGLTKKAYIETFGRLIQFVTGSNPVKQAEILWDDIEPTHRVFIDSEDWPRIKAAARSSTDRVILFLGAYMGLRREEMVRIRTSDIVDGRQLVIHGKGHGKEGRIVVKEIPEPVRVVLKVYLKERESLHLDCDQLLVRVDGRQPGKVMTGASIRHAVDGMSERAGVKFTPHSLRRLYATTMWEASGKDLAVTKAATRHVSSDVLMNCYIRASPDREREAVDRLVEILRGDCPLPAPKKSFFIFLSHEKVGLP